MTYKTRLWILIAIALLIGGGTLFVSPIPQDPAYHLFADLRSCLGIPNFGNVISNAAFTIVGLFGLFVIYRDKPGEAPAPIGDTLPYAVFFAGVALVGVGSAYYHWQPNNETLFWDRLPMTVGFMSITAAIITDRIHRTVGLKLLLPVFLILGAASLVYWSATEAAGRGDLRFYWLVQFLPILLIPLICWLFPNARYTQTRFIAGMLLCYLVALIFDRLDRQFYDLAWNTVSGHTIKHLIAACATIFVIPMWRAGRSMPRQAG